MPQPDHSNPIRRRDLIKGATILTISGSIASSSQAETPIVPGPRPLAIATWNFGRLASDRALQVCQKSGSTLDAVEEGIRVVESSGGSSVGLTGTPNAAGFVQQDACIMHGPGHRAGSVAGLEGVVHPISAARCVMERTPHVMLVGQGARALAIQCGLEIVSNDDFARQAEQWWSAQPKPLPPSHAVENDHDTITLLVLGADGTISGGCSTSGLGGKYPGRVGDSPILGSGLYVDNEVGAAGGTGIGENIMRYGGSLLIVEAMRQGASPSEACEQVVRRIVASEASSKSLDIFFIALDKHGRFGAAGTGEFPHAIAYPGYSEILTSAPVP